MNHIWADHQTSPNGVRAGLEWGSESRFLVAVGIFSISLFAISFPCISKRATFLRIPHLLFFIGKHFGTGVILSTAFCHLLPDAFKSLQDERVNKAYHGIGRLAGLIIMGSLLAIFLVEYTSTSYVDYLYAKPSAPSSPTISRPKTPLLTAALIGPSDNTQDNDGSSTLHPRFSAPQNAYQVSTEVTPLLTARCKPRGRSQSFCESEHRRKKSPLALPFIFLNPPRLSRGGLPLSGMVWGRDVDCLCQTIAPHVDLAIQHVDESDAMVPSEVQDAKEMKQQVGRKRQIIGILVLQLGIMIHSLVIGLTLAVTSGSDFTSLVTAVIFHQLFEGLSLGIRIAGIPRPHVYLDTDPESSGPSPTHHHTAEPWILNWLTPTLSLLFAITTPFGMTVGSYALESSPGSHCPENSVRMLLIQGLMSGISAGMLIYAATVEMLAGDFVFSDVGGEHGHDHHHHHIDISQGGPEPNQDRDSQSHPHSHGSSIRKRVLAVMSLLVGSITMAMVGVSEP